jgi:hypothetical protein
MDAEIFGPWKTHVEAAEGFMQIDGDTSGYTDTTVTQLRNGDLGMNVNGQPFTLSAEILDDTEEFVYSFFMSGNRTFNVEGVVVSGLALTGENPTLVKGGE